MFICNLTGAEYKYENMNLLELRKMMLQQFGLKPWDIYAGYSENSVFNYKEKEKKISDKNTAWKIQLAKNVGKRVTERDAIVQAKIDELTAGEKAAEAEILEMVKAKTGKELSSYGEYKQVVGINNIVPASLLDKHGDFVRSIDAIKSGMNYHKFKVKITPEDLDIFDDKLLFLAKKSFGDNEVETAETLLERFDYRQMICILDYCERNNLSNDEKLLAFKVDITKEYAVHVDDFKGKDYPDFIKMKSSYFDEYEYELYKRVPHDEIYKFIVNELNLYAERVVKVDRDVYYQQVDITPITINIASDGKLELIDGYKRLLYVNNEELLNVNAPIKVFTNLSDEHFIRLLYSANAWKTIDKSWHSIPFHDRGYIFALRQRFGIRFEDYFHNSWKDIDLLQILQIYDTPSKYCLYNKYLVEDLKTLAHLDEIEMPFFKTENNEIYKRVIKSAIRLLGETRRNNLGKEQKLIDFNNFLNRLLADKTLTKKLASKETLSVPGHIDNFFARDVFPAIEEAFCSAI